MSLLPKNKEDFLAWCFNDPAFFIQTCCQIAVKGRGNVPFIFNALQERHHNLIYHYPAPHVAACRYTDVIIAKARQYGQTSWEVADGYHEFAHRPQYVFNVVTYADETAAKIKKFANLLYNSSREFYASIGIDPDKHLPYVKNIGNKHEIYCEATGSLIEFKSAGSKGAGRGLTVNRVYFTEYPEYDHPDEVLSGIIGSAAQEGDVRITKDGTGDGVGTVFYREFMAARSGESGELAVFYGRDDFDYPAGYLEKQRQRLRQKRFNREYPKTIDDAFQKAQNARFDPDHVTRAGRDADGEPALYLSDIMGTEAMADRIHTHGVDTCEGVPTGNYACISTFDFKTNIETAAPWREKGTPRETAFAIRDRVERMPGVVVVERNNHGHAVIQKCCDLKIRTGRFAGRPLSDFLYVHENLDAEKAKKRHRQKVKTQFRYGWPQTEDNKELLMMELEVKLDDDAITIVSDNGRQELKEFQRNEIGWGAPKSSRNAADDNRFYDDEAIAIMLSQVGRTQAARLTISQQSHGFAAKGSQGVPI